MPNPEDRAIPLGQARGEASKQQGFIQQSAPAMTPQEARAPRSQRQAQPTVPDEDPEVLDALFAPPDEHAPGFAQSPGPQTMADLYRGLAEALPSPDLQALTEMTQRLGM